MGKPELLGEHERLSRHDHRRAEDHIVADLCRLSGPGLAAVDDALAHLLEDRLGGGESFRRPAAHEGQRTRLGAGDAAGDRRIDRPEAGGLGKGMGFSRALHVDGGAVDEELTRPRRADDFAPHRDDVLARRQHGDRDVGPCRRLRGAGGDLHAAFRRGVARSGDEIEADDAVARLDQIGGHRAAHVAEADEGDFAHAALHSFL